MNISFPNFPKRVTSTSSFNDATLDDDLCVNINVLFEGESDVANELKYRHKKVFPSYRMISHENVFDHHFKIV